MNRRFLPWLLWLLLPAIALGAAPVDPAGRFLGTWEGPANVYDDSQVMKPTNVKVIVKPADGRPGEYVVELTLFGDKLSRFTHCRLRQEDELQVRDEVRVDLRRVRVEGVLKSRRPDRIEEGYVLFNVETATGAFRPYYVIKFAAKRLPAAPPPPVTPPPVPGKTDGS
ncbi:MAG: hypothetical protein GX444_14650 [Myxococcales bacterium]|nr:hypothetical protein [Myxococcales bacterium]